MTTKWDIKRGWSRSPKTDQCRIQGKTTKCARKRIFADCREWKFSGATGRKFQGAKVPRSEFRSREQMVLGAKGCDHTGHRPYQPQQNTISATRKINIGQNHIGHKIYGWSIWHHPDDTSRFRVVRMVNLNVKEANIFPIVQRRWMSGFSKNRQYFTTYWLLSLLAFLLWSRSNICYFGHFNPFLIDWLIDWLLHASLVNPKYFSLVSHFYYENPFNNITVAHFLHPL